MSASAPSKPSSASKTLIDLLRVLPTAARKTLVASFGCFVKREMRLVCRALRELVDEEVTEVQLECDDPALFLPLCQHGRWLSRRPRCKSVHIITDVDNPAVFALPFSWAAPEACARVTDLTLDWYQNGSKPQPLPSTLLLGLLPRLTALRGLTLHTCAAPEDLLERTLTAAALASLRHLDCLVLCDYGFLNCLSGLEARLTRLVVGTDTAPVSGSPPPPAELAAQLCGFKALKTFVLNAEDECLRDDQLAGLLGALVDAPCLDTLELHFDRESGQCRLDCRYSVCGSDSDGTGLRRLSAVTATAKYWPYAKLSTFLATALLPSHALGPRLGRLEICGAVRHQAGDPPLPSPDPAVDLLRRCDVIVAKQLLAAPRKQDTLAICELLGVPEEFQLPCSDGALLTFRKASLAAGCGNGGGGEHAGGSGGGGGQGSGACAPLSYAQVLAQAAQRLAAAAAPEDHASQLLVRGPLIRALLAAPAALVSWLQQAHTQAAIASGRRQQCATGYQALPAAGAVLLLCSPGAGPAVAAAVRWLAAAGGGGAAEVLPTCLPWLDAVEQVLQAWWSGAGMGPSRASCGAEARAKEGPAAAAAGVGSGGALDRVRCLLETWEAVSAAPQVPPPARS